MSIQSESFQDKFAKETRCRTDAITLDPVSLFNYRLRTAISRDRLNDAELGDFESLWKAFGGKLHSHRKHIDVNTARVAAGRNPIIGLILDGIGVDVGAEGGPGPQSSERNERDGGSKQELAKGLKSLFHWNHT
jgi:hypothetical protein